MARRRNMSSERRRERQPVKRPVTLAAMLVMVLSLAIAAMVLLDWGFAEDEAGGRLNPLSDPQPELPRVEVKIGGKVFRLETATTRAQHFWGLSNREAIESDGGMLFVMPHSRPRQFVMRRCLVPIDLLFLDNDGVITTLHEMQVQPYDTPSSELTPYPSDGPARFAIELAGGTIDRLGLEVGDRVELPPDDLKAGVR